MSPVLAGGFLTTGPPGKSQDSALSLQAKQVRTLVRELRSYMNIPGMEADLTPSAGTQNTEFGGSQWSPQAECPLHKSVHDGKVIKK